MNYKNFVAITIVLTLLMPMYTSAENIVSSGDPLEDVYDLVRNIAAFDSVEEISEIEKYDYICGGDEAGIPGDDCTIDQSTKKGLYRETISNGTRFDLRKVTVENYGTPHFVHLDVFVCYRIIKSDAYSNQLDCTQTANDLYEGESDIFLTNSHLGDEIFVYIIAREGSGGDQTQFGIKVELVSDSGSNSDQVEPRNLTGTNIITDSVCQAECNSAPDTDLSDGYVLPFFKGDSFSIEFWSTTCEAATGDINYQIRAFIYIWRPSNLETPYAESWNLNEQFCDRSDGFFRFELQNADESGRLLLWFRATDSHNDNDKASYNVQLTQYDTTSRDLNHDQDQDGFSDVQEYQCLKNYWYSQDFPTDTDADTECNLLDEDDDNDGVLDNDDACPLDYYTQNSGEYADHDGNGCQNIIDSDDDNDGVPDEYDTCPLGESNITANELNDLDGDGCLDVEDPDDDGDGWNDDVEENCNTDPRNADDSPLDFDNDGECDELDDDDDNDGHDDPSDRFPYDIDEWEDTDNDGIGNNADTDDDGDDVEDIVDVFPLDPTQSTDIDGDGCGDNPSGINGDQFPNEPTQCSDADGDGYGDNWANMSWTDRNPSWPGEYHADAIGQDFCPTISGTSTKGGLLGCPDSDDDGWANSIDDLPQESTQWIDSDGHGYGENPNGMEPDFCPLSDGTSNIDVFGCIDQDFDGWSDDGDDCPTSRGTSRLDRKGCLDSDGDGFSDPDPSSPKHPNGLSDAFPFEASQSMDRDGDGFGDNISGFQGDVCPNEWGNSTLDRLGCLDSDGDKWSEIVDLFPTDSGQWNDTDGDGFGDNSKMKNGDQCLDKYGTSEIGKARGCPDVDGDGIPDKDDHCDKGNNEYQKMNNTCIKAILAGDGGLFFFLEAQGAALLFSLPLFYAFAFWLRNRPSNDDDDWGGMEINLFDHNQ